MPQTTTNPRFAKDPSATRDFSVDWADVLIDKPGVTLSSLACSVSPSGLTLGSTSTSGTLGTCRISGGTLGTMYEVAFAGTFSNGEIDVQRILINVQEIPVGL